MKRFLAIVLFGALCLTLGSAFVACDSEQGEASPLDALTLLESFEDGKPYHLYFVSDGDGTCTLRYLTTDPENDSDFVIEIPEKSPAGDTVVSIDLQLKNGVLDHARPDNFPTVLTAEDFDAICNKMGENGASDFVIMKFKAYYFERFAGQLEGKKLEKMLKETPIAALGNVYVFAPEADRNEADWIMNVLQTYAAWDKAAYDECCANLLALAKQSESLEQAEACLSTVRYGSTEHVIGISIPETVTSVNQDMYEYLPSVEENSDT